MARFTARSNSLTQVKFHKPDAHGTVGNTVRFFPMRETSGEQSFRNPRLLMLESCVKGLQLLDGHSHRNITRHLSPLRNRTMNFAQNFKSVLVREMEVSRSMHSVFYFSRRPCLFRQPGFEIASLIRKRIQIERRRQSPLSMSHMQESMIVEVIIDIRNQHVENDPPP